MARAIIGDKNYDIKFDSDNKLKGTINGEVFDFKIDSNIENNHSVLYRNSVFDIDLISIDIDKKLINLLVNGNLFELELEDKYDFIINKLGLRKSKSIKEGFVESIMPGLIIDIHVSEGESVFKGQKLVTLEAMKMENIIKSPSNSTIKEISITKGNTVEKGDILFILE